MLLLKCGGWREAEFFFPGKKVKASACNDSATANCCKKEELVGQVMIICEWVRKKERKGGFF